MISLKEVLQKSDRIIQATTEFGFSNEVFIYQPPFDPPENLYLMVSDDPMLPDFDDLSFLSDNPSLSQDTRKLFLGLYLDCFLEKRCNVFIATQNDIHEGFLEDINHNKKLLENSDEVLQIFDQEFVFKKINITDIPDEELYGETAQELMQQIQTKIAALRATHNINTHTEILKTLKPNDGTLVQTNFEEPPLTKNEITTTPIVQKDQAVAIENELSLPTFQSSAF